MSSPSRSRSRAGRIRRESAEDLFEELADRMANEDVALLDAGCRGRRDAEAHVAEIAHAGSGELGQRAALWKRKGSLGSYVATMVFVSIEMARV